MNCQLSWENRVITIFGTVSIFTILSIIIATGYSLYVVNYHFGGSGLSHTPCPDNYTHRVKVIADNYVKVDNSIPVYRKIVGDVQSGKTYLMYSSCFGLDTTLYLTQQYIPYHNNHLHEIMTQIGLLIIAMFSLLLVFTTVYTVCYLGDIVFRD